MTDLFRRERGGKGEGRHSRHAPSNPSPLLLLMPLQRPIHPLTHWHVGICTLHRQEQGGYGEGIHSGHALSPPTPLLFPVPLQSPTHPPTHPPANGHMRPAQTATQPQLIIHFTRFAHLDLATSIGPAAAFPNCLSMHCCAAAAHLASFVVAWGPRCRTQVCVCSIILA